MNTIKINVTQETKDVVESLFWILEEIPKNIATSSSSNTLIIFNLEKDKKLELNVTKV